MTLWSYAEMYANVGGQVLTFVWGNDNDFNRLLGTATFGSR